MRVNLLALWLVVSTVLLTACETMTSSRRIAVNPADQWALLPMSNLSKTPLADSRAIALIETHLRARGVTRIEAYKPPADQSVLALLDDTSQLEDAKQWARKAGYRFGVTGSVQEWEYKNGLDNEPSVGLTLKFIDLSNDNVVWQGTASRTGWGYANLSSVGSKTIDGMLAEVRFKSPTGPTPMLARQPLVPAPTAPAALPVPETAAATPINIERGNLQGPRSEFNQ